MESLEFSYEEENEDDNAFNYNLNSSIIQLQKKCSKSSVNEN